MKRFAAYLPALTFFLAGFSAPAQPVEHAHWAAAFDPATAAPGGKALARIEASIDPGWHLYSASSAAGIPASFHIAGQVVESTRLFQTRPKRAFDSNFNIDTETYYGEAGFAVEVSLRKDAPAGPAEIAVNARFQTCSDTQCVPGKWSGKAVLTVASGAVAAVAIPAGYNEVAARAASQSQGPSGSQPEQGLVLFLLTAFGFGLAAIFTPCVFPMIPITMSYFLNRPAGGRQDGIAQAVVFCLGIVVLFSGMGLVTTAILGPVGVKHLASSPWVNGFITALFVAFGLSLLGAFEITIPSGILTRLNASSGQGGYAGALLMGLTFSLSSFACVGPFVGSLLAASVSGGGVRPLAGMALFASGLALPFFLLALFPGYLKRMPRSGGWLARVKVVMGFLILAASLYYLAKVDQTLGWGWLTRERFLAAWMVLFAMAGLYLLGFVRLEGIKPDEPLGLGRLLTGMALAIFALSLAPGMAGGKLGELDAYVPAAEGGAGSASASASLDWITDDYAGALARARSQGKLLFIDFTGIACTNCHWMRANMLSRPEIEAALGNFVLVELYTDRSDAVSERNEKLLEDKFHTSAEPFYAIMDAGERPLATFDRLTRDPAEYLAFLRQGSQAPPAPANAADIGTPRTALDGAPIDTAGKVVVLDFWATYCEPCVREIPGLNKLYRELSPRGLAIVGVDIDQDDAELVKPFLAKHPMDYPVALGTPSLGTRYGVEGFPATLIFDRSGKLVKRFAQFTGEAEMRAAIEGVL
jgi:thiol:disulfide interchange protein DsbD